MGLGIRRVGVEGKERGVVDGGRREAIALLCPTDSLSVSVLNDCHASFETGRYFCFSLIFVFKHVFSLKIDVFELNNLVIELGMKLST